MRYIKFAVLFFLVCFCATGSGFAQVKEEKEEKFLKMERLRVKPAKLKWSVNAGLFAGYDSNVNLSPRSKGDIFEETLLSANIEKPWIRDSKFTFNYDFAYLNFNEVTNASNFLNHFRLAAHKKVSFLTLGTGYDLDILAYPHDDNVDENGDFAFHKFFLYAKHDITKRIYQQLFLEYGLKDYFNRKALGDTINTYQDKERLDRRQTVEYSIAAPVMPKVLLRIKGKYALNKSNARYVNYYDYESYTGSSSVDIRMSKKLLFYTNFGYTRKVYLDRIVFNENYKEKDKFYYAYAELRYLLKKNNTIVLSYTYRNNASNEPLEKFNENVCSLGWQYSF